MVTNRGRFRLLGLMRGETLPTNFYLVLFTSAVAPTTKINTFSQLTEIPEGRGYTSGGYQLTPGETDFDVLTEDDDNDLALMQLKDIIWTASGGSLPASGDGARYACLTDDNTTMANREVWAAWDLTENRKVSDTQELQLKNLELQLAES